MLSPSLRIRLAIGIEEIFPTFFPRGLHLKRRDVPIRPALLCDGTQVLAELFNRRTAEEPLAVVDLINDEARLENNDVRNHRIAIWIGVFGNIDVLLNDSSCIGEKRPVRTDA